MCACVKNLTCVGAKQAELFNFVSAAKAPIATQAHTHVLLPDLWCAYVCMLRMCVCCICVCCVCVCVAYVCVCVLLYVALLLFKATRLFPTQWWHPIYRCCKCVQSYACVSKKVKILTSPTHNQLYTYKDHV